MNCSCTNGGEGERRTAAQENIAKIIGKFQGRQGLLFRFCRKYKNTLLLAPLGQTLLPSRRAFVQQRFMEW